MSSLNGENSGHSQVLKRKPGPKRFSNLLGVTGGTSKENVSHGKVMTRPTTTTTTTPEVTVRQLDPQEYTRGQLKLQAERLENLEEVIMVKVPLLQTLAEEVSTLRKELETEREKDRGTFMQCIQNLMGEVVQVNLKLMVLEERIEESEKLRLEAVTSPVPAPPEPSQSQTGSDVTEMINLLTDDIQAKFLEVSQSQTSLQAQIERVKNDMDYLNYVFAPPVEAILDASPPPPLGTPLLNLAKWGYENLNEMFPIPDDDQIDSQSIMADDKKTPSPKDNEAMDDYSISDIGTEDVEDGLHVIHQRALRPGRYLPFLCQCSLEFDSEASLAEHVNIKVKEDTDDDCKILEPPITNSRILSKNSRSSSSSSNTLRKLGKVLLSKRTEVIRKRGHDLGKKMLPHPPVGIQGSSSDKHCLQNISTDGEGHQKFHCKCGRSYSSKGNLHLHVRRASGQGQGQAPRFKCSLCPTHYARRDRLNVHMRRKHNVNMDHRKRNIWCSKCNKSFANRKQYAEHRPCPVIKLFKN